MKVAICEDEQYWVNTLKTSIAKWANVRNVKCYAISFLSPKEIVDYLTAHLDIDVLFLDISLGDKVIDGMTLAKRIRKTGSKVPIIFVTVDSYRAVDGYLVEAMGFLSKPIDENRLALFLDRILKQQRNRKAIKITADGHITNVYQNDIVYAEINDHTVIYHTTQGCLKFRGTLREVLAALDSDFFIQIHRSFIISLDKIQSIKATYPYSVNLQLSSDFANVPVSRKYINTLLEAYSDVVLEKMI